MSTEGEGLKAALTGAQMQTKHTDLKEWRMTRLRRVLGRCSCHGGAARLLSPLGAAGLEFLAVSEDARRARVQLDEELRELVLGEHGL